MSPARDTAEAQLQRLLWLIPAAVRGDGLTLAEAAERLGVEEDQIHRDVHALTRREFYLPAGTAELITVELTDRLRIHTTGRFGRPPRLTRAELVCVLLGLRMRPGDHREMVARLEKALAMPGAAPAAEGLGVEGVSGAPGAAGTSRAGEGIPGGAEPDPGAGAAAPPAADPGAAPGAGAPEDADPAPVAFPDLEDAGRADAVLATLRRARERRQPCRFGYLKPGGEAPEIRRLHCYALVHAEGAWYAAGRDPDADGHRNFRVDRVLGIAPDGEAGTFEIPEDFDPGALLEGARLFQPPEDGEVAEVEIRYGPRVVPWVREQWDGEADGDGCYRVRHPVGDPDWVVRHVLQYGPDAEVVGPPEMRAVVREAAERMPGAAGRRAG